MYVYFLEFIIGAFIGSFLGVLIDRIPKSMPFVSERSKCVSCKKTLFWYELIPVFSYLFLKGKCRNCKSIIPFELLLYEVLSGLMFIIVIEYFRSLLLDPVKIVLYLIIFSCFFIIFFIDLKHNIIPDVFLLIIFFISASLFFLMDVDILSRVITGILSFLFFFIIFAITRGKGMGFGDVKLSFIIGFFLGYPSVVISFYAAFFIGALVSLLLVLAKRKSFRKDTVPFAPFLIIGVLIAFFFAREIITNFNLFYLTF